MPDLVHMKHSDGRTLICEQHQRATFAAKGFEQYTPASPPGHPGRRQDFRPAENLETIYDPSGKRCLCDRRQAPGLLANGWSRQAPKDAEPDPVDPGDIVPNEVTQEDLQAALGALDHQDDSVWTAQGLPRLDVIRDLLANETITREQVTQAWPDFKRQMEAG